MADISKIDNGTEYNLKDAVARAGIASSKTLKSSVVTVNDAAPINAEDITVDITPKQDLHGYDRPWAGGVGKNKLPMTVAGIKALNTGGTWSGNIYTRYNTSFEILTDNADNVVGVKVTGTPSNEITLILNFTGVNGTGYILSGCPANGSSSTYRLDTFGEGVSNVADYGNSASFTASGNSQYVRLLIKSGYAIPTSGILYYPMIRLATETDATFAPYSNICPIEGRTGAELDRVEKNWLPNNYSSSSAAGISYTVNNDGTVIASNTATNISSFGFGGIKRIKAGSYILNGCPIGGSSSTFELQIVINGTTYRDYGSGVAFSTDHDADYSIQILIRNGYACPIGGLLFKAMIRLASITDSTYEPYQGQQYTASFGETVHGGKWHVTKGGTDKTMREVDLGGLTWSYTPGYGGLFYAPVPDAKYSGNLSLIGYGCYSSQYKSKGNTSWTRLSNGEINVGSDTAGVGKPYVNVKDNRYSDATAFKAAMNGVQLVYERETPTTISTPKQDVPMLQGINTVSADCGDTQLKYQPDNVIGELKGEIEDNIIYEDFKWTTQSSQSYSAGTPGTYGTSSWRDVKKEGYDVIGVTFVENRRFGDCILTLYYIPSTSHVEVIIFRATSSAVTIADEDIEYRVAYKKRA